MRQREKDRLVVRGIDPQLYELWKAMHGRCTNPNHKKYPRYGGRGITVDPSWDDFVVFAAHVGAHPGLGWSIDRIDNDQCYRPGNVRWATPAMQAQNRRNTKLSVGLIAQIRLLDGKMSQGEIARRIGIDQSTISDVMRGEAWA